jgi:hypothetical protein
LLLHLVLFAARSEYNLKNNKRQAENIEQEQIKSDVQNSE